MCTDIVIVTVICIVLVVAAIIVITRVNKQYYSEGTFTVTNVELSTDKKFNILKGNYTSGNLMHKDVEIALDSKSSYKVGDVVEAYCCRLGRQNVYVLGSLGS